MSKLDFLWKPNFLGRGMLLGTLALAGGCGSFGVSDPETNRRDSEPIYDFKSAERNEESARVAARAQNEFGLKLLRVVAEKQPKENTFVSPTSVWMALAMAEKGTRGDAQTELRRVLALQKNNDASVTALRATLAAQGLKINLANAIWADEETPFAPVFTQKSAQIFGATAKTLNFQAPQSVDTINTWVEKQTDGEIKNLVKELPLAGAVLTNALYFRGRWQTPFEKSATEDAPFYLPDGTQKSVPFMSGEGFQGFKGASFEGAILPYANSSCELWAVLPAKGKTPLEVMKNLNAAKLDKITPGFQTEIRLPRVSLDWGASLKSSLQTLGLKTVFTNPDLRPMGFLPPAYLSEVKHKTRLEIDEQGTVAAAATEENFPASADSLDEPKNLVFDRPFLLLLRETRSGAVLFAGIINDPQK